MSSFSGGAFGGGEIEVGVQIANAIGAGERNIDPTLSATRLVNISRDASWVAISAKPTNLGTIWVAGSTVEDGIGIPLYAMGSPVKFDIDDIGKIYFIGIEGDGVVFTYGYRQVDSGSDEGALLGVDGDALGGVSGDSLGGV